MSTISEESDQSGTPVIINLDSLGPRVQKNLSEYISTIQMLPLETSGQVRVSKLRDIEITDELIFILDASTGNVLVFDLYGSYVRTIGNTSEEKTKSNAIEVDPENEKLYILDWLKKSFFVYSFTGEFIKHIPLNVEGYVREFKVVADDSFLIHVAPPFQKRCSPLILVDGEGTITKEYLKDMGIFMSTKRQNVLHKNGEHIYFTLPYSNNIYSYSNEELIPVIRLESEHSVDLDQLKKAEQIQHASLQSGSGLMDMVPTSDNYNGLHNVNLIFARSEVMYLSYNDGLQGHSILVDLNTGTAINAWLYDDLAKDFRSDDRNLPSFFHSQNGDVISLLYFVTFDEADTKNLKRSVSENPGILKSDHPDVQKRIDAFEIFSNPALIFFN